MLLVVDWREGPFLTFMLWSLLVPWWSRGWALTASFGAALRWKSYDHRALAYLCKTLVSCIQELARKGLWRREAGTMCPFGVPFSCLVIFVQFEMLDFPLFAGIQIYWGLGATFTICPCRPPKCLFFTPKAQRFKGDVQSLRKNTF